MKTLIYEKGIVALAALLLTPFCVFYFAQHSLSAPNGVDEGLILDYIQLMAQGKKPFWDFFDLYGPLNWMIPTFAYVWAGEKVIGIRIWIIALKLITVGLTYGFSARLSNRFYGLLAALLMTLMLGQDWQYLQIAYPFLLVLPLLLATWWLFLGSAKRYPLKMVLAGICTAVIIVGKLNSGLFLFAAGLFYCWYWCPLSEKMKWQGGRAPSLVIGLIQFLGIAAYAIIFFRYIQPFFNKQYFFYLLLPLLILLGVTLRHVWFERARSDYGQIFRYRIRVWSLYFGVTLSSWSILNLIYYGVEGNKQFYRELYAILLNIHYMVPFPPLGAEGLYQSFTKYYWSQLPWLLTGLTLVWIVLQWISPDLPFFQRTRWSQTRRQWIGLWGFLSLNAFVMYSRSDEAHLLQAVFPVIPYFVVMVYYLEQTICRRKFAHALFLRGTFLVVLCLWGAPIASMPKWEPLMEHQRHWHSPRLEGLRFSEHNRHIIREFEDAINQSSAYIASRVAPGTEVGVLSKDELINFNSHTQPIGGRYRYFFYLLRNDFINRKTFDELVPAPVLTKLFKHPPPLLVTTKKEENLVRHLPEFKKLIREHYHLVQQFPPLIIYEHRSLSTLGKLE